MAGERLSEGFGRPYPGSKARCLRTPFTPTVDPARLPAGAYMVVLLDRSGTALARARVVKQ